MSRTRVCGERKPWNLVEFSPVKSQRTGLQNSQPTTQHYMARKAIARPNTTHNIEGDRPSPHNTNHSMTSQVITRPNTGTSGYEMDLQELREKYDRVSDEEQATGTVQNAWSLVNFGRSSGLGGHKFLVPAEAALKVFSPKYPVGLDVRLVRFPLWHSSLSLENRSFVL